MNKLGFYVKPFKEIESYFDLIDLAVEYGHSSLEALSIMEFETPDLEKAQKVRDYADSKNIKFCCISAFFDFTKEDYDEAMERLKKYAQIAQILGSPYLHHTVLAEFEDPARVLAERDKFFEIGIRAVREIYDYAKPLGVQTIYEDQGFIFNGVKGLGALLENADRDIGLVVDFGNIAQSGDEVTQLLRAYPDKVRHVHIKDVRVTDEPLSEGSLPTINNKYMTEVKLGTGDVRLKEALSILKEIGYNGYMSAEFPAPNGNGEEMKECFALIAEYLG